MDQEQKKSRQEEAYDFVSSTFVKLLEGDNRISYEHKRSVIAFWEDLFAHEGVRNNMVQAFSNFLFEIDTRVDSARKAGIMQALSAIELHSDSNNGNYSEIVKLLEDLLKSEEAPEEKVNVEEMDLSEVGGGNEDDTSPL